MGWKFFSTSCLRSIQMRLTVFCVETLIGENGIQRRLYEAFAQEVVFVKSCTWRHSSQFFIVYINNLTGQRHFDIQNCLVDCSGYVGWVNCYSPSFLKTYLSFILCNVFLKAKKLMIIQGHEDDRDNSEDVNMVGYPFEEHGYTCKSFQSMYNDLFLHYKIERGVYPGFESDTLFSLNAISNSVVPLEECEVIVEDPKLRYLQEQKEGSMKKSGLLPLTREEVQAKIRQRLAENYIFNMSYAPEHQTMKFNTILNFTPADVKKPIKLTVSLKYEPSIKRVRLITMF